MLVNKQYFLGEALYRLSIYERGRCTPSKILWTKKYTSQLANSINLMDEMLQALSNKKITSHDYEVIRKIITNKVQLHINEESLNQLKNGNYTLSSVYDLSSYNEVNQLMNTIITQLKQSITSLNKRNKRRIWYLLQALHNLPKVYLNSGHESLFNYPSPSISITSALKCAKNYLNMMD